MIGDLIGEWIKGILIDGIMGNLSGLFNTVNTKVGEIASDVGLSETVIVPIAAAILALVMCYELIDMIVEKNNMHDFDSSMFFRWIFKSAFAILIVTNTWNIVIFENLCDLYNYLDASIHVQFSFINRKIDPSTPRALKSGRRGTTSTTSAASIPTFCKTSL